MRKNPQNQAAGRGAGASGPGAGGNAPGKAGPRPGREGGRAGERKAGQTPGGRGGGAQAAVEVRPPASPAQLQPRHRGLVISFVLAVVLPLLLVVVYLWWVADDQYASSVGFTVRKEESVNASDLLGGLSQFAAGSTSSDTDILYEFILSPGLVAEVDRRLDLRGHYSAHWRSDPVFALWPDATDEQLVWYWSRVVRISYDQGTGLMDLQVLAYDPDMAQAIAREIVAESQDMINALNAAAREDAMRYAREDLEVAVERLRAAREALTRFRIENQLVDPEADIQGRMGVLNNLQQQLAQALIDYDLLATTTNASDPRLAQARRRIDVIRERIATERENFASDQGTAGPDGRDYPTLLAEYESLNVDRQVAEEAYRAALAALDVARANASRQSRYLATYIPPTRASSAEYPRRVMLAGLAALFLVLAWSIGALVFYSLRDRG